MATKTEQKKAEKNAVQKSAEQSAEKTAQKTPTPKKTAQKKPEKKTTTVEARASAKKPTTRLPIPGTSTFRDLRTFLTPILGPECLARRGRGSYWARSSRELGVLDCSRVHVWSVTCFTIATLLRPENLDQAYAWARHTLDHLPPSDRTPEADRARVLARVGLVPGHLNTVPGPSLTLDGKTFTPSRESVVMATAATLLTAQNAPDCLLDAVVPTHCWRADASARMADLAKRDLAS